MKLKVRNIGISAGGTLIVILNREDASLLDLHSLDRIKIKKGSRTETVVIDTCSNCDVVPRGSIAVFEEVQKLMQLKNGDALWITPSGTPLSIEFIKKKLDGHVLDKNEIRQIVWDITNNKLSDIELTYFVSACYSRELNVTETTLLTKAMADEGDKLKLRSYPVMDKHCVGGVAGNRTTPIIVAIVAAAGLAIPKTSSRSITSPAGTADTVEVLTNVIIPISEMKSIVTKTNGCLVWGGSLNLAPADDKIIRVEKPLGIDAKSQLLASVMAKKASVSATHLVIDIPAGRGAKISMGREAKLLKRDFENLSKKLGIKAKVVITDGTQPIGNGIGPALEAKDVLYVLRDELQAPQDLKEKSLMLAGLLLELGGKARRGEGKALARDILESGKAYNKFIEIIRAQGGREIMPGKIELARFRKSIKAVKSGKIASIPNESISKTARVAGAPANKGAGIYLYRHVGDRVRIGERLFTIYSDSRLKLKFAVKTYKKLGQILIS